MMTRLRNRRGSFDPWDLFVTPIVSNSEIDRLGAWWAGQVANEDARSVANTDA